MASQTPAICPECGQPLAESERATHLRTVHGYIDFGGVVLPRPAGLQRLWDRVFGNNDRDAHEQICRLLLPEGDAIVDPTPWMVAFATEVERRQLGLKKQRWRRLPPLSSRRTPPILRQAAAVVLLRAFGTDGKTGRRILRAALGQNSRSRALRQLNAIETQLGPAPLFERVRTHLQEQIRMRCPRCQAQLRQPDMAEHLWQKHRLLLLDHQVRTPWRVIGDWIAEYRKKGAMRLLQRCRALAQNADPENGLLRLYSMLWQQGLATDEERQTLVEEAEERRATLCPHCYHLVPVPPELPLRGLERSRGRIAAGGYSVDVTERGLLARLEIRTPRQTIFDGIEPGHWFTRRGASLLLSGPPVLLALLLAMLLPRFGMPPLAPVLCALWLGLVAWLIVRFTWRNDEGDRFERAIDHAWNQLVPRLHARGFSADDSDFIANLALTSLHHGHPNVRAPVLPRVLHQTEQAVGANLVPVTHLASVQRLLLADRARGGGDLTTLLVAHIGRCFEGKLSLRFADQLLSGWDFTGGSAGKRARLRVLLADRAFEAGLELRDVLEAGLIAPTLGALLECRDADALAQLRLLWRQRVHRPWDRWGEAITVFELAGERTTAGIELLARHPDLLLADRSAPPIYLGSQGVTFLNTLFTTEPSPIELRTRPIHDVEGSELVVGKHQFRFGLEPIGLVGRLQRWFGFYFKEFRPNVAEVHGWTAPETPRLLRPRDMVRCGECGERLVPRLGQVGVPRFTNSVRRPRKRKEPRA